MNNFKIKGLPEDETSAIVTREYNDESTWVDYKAIEGKSVIINLFKLLERYVETNRNTVTKEVLELRKKAGIKEGESLIEWAKKHNYSDLLASICPKWLKVANSILYSKEEKLAHFKEAYSIIDTSSTDKEPIKVGDYVQINSKDSAFEWRVQYDGLIAKVLSKTKTETGTCWFEVDGVVGGWSEDMIALVSRANVDDKSMLPATPSQIVKINSSIIKPYWGTAPDWANWLAQDSSGIWYWYAKTPKRNNGGFYTDGKYEEAEVCNWENSLEERPKQGLSKLEVEIPNLVDSQTSPLGISIEEFAAIEPGDEVLIKPAKECGLWGMKHTDICGRWVKVFDRDCRYLLVHDNPFGTAITGLSNILKVRKKYDL